MRIGRRTSIVLSSNWRNIAGLRFGGSRARPRLRSQATRQSLVAQCIARSRAETTRYRTQAHAGCRCRDLPRKGARGSPGSIDRNSPPSCRFDRARSDQRSTVRRVYHATHRPGCSSNIDVGSTRCRGRGYWNSAPWATASERTLRRSGYLKAEKAERAPGGRPFCFLGLH